MIKKIIIIAAIIIGIQQATYWLNEYMDDRLFAGYYLEPAEIEEKSLWEKIKIFFTDLVSDDDEKDKYIYR